MPRCLIALGANLGNRERTLQRATELLAERVGELVAASESLASHAVGGPSGQPEFLNAAALCETALPPERVLAALHQIEAELGRRRLERWEARTLDLDLLLYENYVADDRQLQLPHPRMAFRKFVLQPAAQVAPEMVHPPTKFTVAELLERLAVRPQHLVVLGAEADEAVREVAERAGGATLLRATVWGASSQPAAEPLECLACGAAAWQRAERDSPRLIVSDFWIGELASDASGDVAAQELLAQLDQQDRVWYWPHLAVVVERGAEFSAAVPQASAFPAGRVAGTGTTTGWIGGATGFYRPRQFPVLHLRGADQAAVVTEALVAIDAMQ